MPADLLVYAMPESPRCRIRLRLPTGAELETEGEAEFVRAESQRLIEIIERGPRATGTVDGPRKTAPSAPLPELWREVAEPQKGGLVLRSRPAAGDIEEACLLLLAAARNLLSSERPTATQLARWLRMSGCPFKRLDRVLADAIRRNDVLAAGNRRSRRYELTPSGLAKAGLAAHRLAQKISG